MEFKVFQNKIESLQQRLATLQQAIARPGSPLEDHLPELYQDLSTSLEELQVAEEELHIQNEALARAQLESEAERRRYEDLFNFAPDAYLVTDAEGNIHEANLAAEALFSLRRDLLKAKSICSFFNPEDQAAYYRLLSDLKRLNIIRNWEITLHPRVCQPFPALISLQTIRNQSGRFMGIRWLIRDITEQKMSQETLHRQAENLQRSNTELEQFAYVASHDLQEPIRMVAGFMGLLEKEYAGKLDENARELICFAVEGAQRMQKLISDLLEFSRVSSRGRELHPVDTRAILEKVLFSLGFAIEEAGAKISGDPLPRVLGDEVQLSQVFQNLIDNALKFRGTRPPEIHIGVQKLNSYYQFSVRDNGIGIEPQYHERIFSLFQRLHTRKAYPGTGIGLAIVKKIIDRHGGKIWLESVPDEGTTFHFTLPAADGE